MASTLKCDIFKGKINGILNNINYQYKFNFNSRSDWAIESNKIDDLPLCDLIMWLSKTPDQGQATSHADETKKLPNCDISEKELNIPLFTTSSHTIWIGYSAVVTQWLSKPTILKSRFASLVAVNNPF